jgi:hypothetical protein
MTGVKAWINHEKTRIKKKLPPHLLSNSHYSSRDPSPKWSLDYSFPAFYALQSEDGSFYPI